MLHTKYDLYPDRPGGKKSKRIFGKMCLRGSADEQEAEAKKRWKTEEPLKFLQQHFEKDPLVQRLADMVGNRAIAEQVPEWNDEQRTPPPPPHFGQNRRRTAVTAPGNGVPVPGKHRSGRGCTSSTKDPK